MLPGIGVSVAMDWSGCCHGLEGVLPGIGVGVASDWR